jgi:SWIM zinc finger
LVPSANDSAVVGFYEVRLGPVEACECADFEHRGKPCKHIHAAALAQSKSGICSCCGQRVLDRFLSEVTEDDGLLSWFAGDALCGDCVKAGFWT